MSIITPSRRQLMGFGLAGTSSLLLSGCNRLSQSAALIDGVSIAEQWNMTTHRLIGRLVLAREFSLSDISPNFKANGTRTPDTDQYAQWLQTNFATWNFTVSGLVQKPLRLSLEHLKSLPQRTQITRHDCVEGWSAIGQWTGVPLSILLKNAGLAPSARYVIFECADYYGGEPEKGGMQSMGKYYESIDLVDAFHPQTILAHSLNGKALPVGNGAPLRLRVERQLGYKQAKYLTGIRITDTLDNIGGGKGGYWEDRGYEWYAGI